MNVIICLYCYLLLLNILTDLAVAQIMPINKPAIFDNGLSYTFYETNRRPLSSETTHENAQDYCMSLAYDGSGRLAIVRDYSVVAKLRTSLDFDVVGTCYYIGLSSLVEQWGDPEGSNYQESYVWDDTYTQFYSDREGFPWFSNYEPEDFYDKPCACIQKEADNVFSTRPESCSSSINFICQQTNSSFSTASNTTIVTTSTTATTASISSTPGTIFVATSGSTTTTTTPTTTTTTTTNTTAITTSTTTAIDVSASQTFEMTNDDSETFTIIAYAIIGILLAIFVISLPVVIISLYVGRERRPDRNRRSKKKTIWYTISQEQRKL